MPELELLLDTVRKKEWNANKFAAALKGVKVDDYDAAHSTEKTADDIRREAEAEVRGMTEEQLAFEEIGIQIIEE